MYLSIAFFSEIAVAVSNLRRFDELGRTYVVCIHRPHRLAMRVVSEKCHETLAYHACASSHLPPSGATPRPSQDAKMHRASCLRPLLQHQHPPRRTNFVRCFSHLCSLWRQFESDLEILETGIGLLLRCALIETLLQAGPFAAFATVVDKITADGAF